MNPKNLTTILRRSAIVAGAGAILALGVACTPTTEVTVAGEGTATQGIAVSGTGTVSVRPDIALVNLGIEVTADTVADARGQAADAMAAMQDAMEGEGVAEADIQTQYFNIYPMYQYSENSAPQIVGYTVSNVVQVKVRNLDSVSAVLDGAIDAGGDSVRVNGISFTVEDPEEYLGDARREAVDNARMHAEVLAEAAGVELGAPISINEFTSFDGGYYPAADRAEGGMGGATPVNPGEQELRVNVSVVFGIE
ncbi:MAG: SIMPL domain-containing protein [Dehalococcoidia bacterium]